jgi:Xaa-Pro aminopeptidase
MHPTLLVGPYDWQPERLPKSEFVDRMQALWNKISGTPCSVVIVYGDSRHHAELAYLSNFVPKLGPALMFIPRKGAPRLLVSGAPNMLPAAKRLTWIEEVEPLRDVGKAVLRALNGGAGSNVTTSDTGVALIGGGRMRSAFYRSLREVFDPDNALVEATQSLQTLMRCKSPRELTLIREGSTIVGAAAKALAKAQGTGLGVTSAILEAERVANHLGAQDVRTLFSVDGGRTLQPFEALIDSTIDPLQVYIAVRYAGYWVEGFVFISAAQHSVAAKAANALTTLVTKATAGTKASDLVRLATESITPYGSHAMTAGSIGNTIGLSLEEEPQLSANSGEVLEAGGVYTLRVGASDGHEQHCIVSAVVAVHEHGNELLWSAV